ncbi:unnamed protein product [Allacma fusca]|uniref:Protein GUCD1 n=1 Tax=Allacma fusca TaxID=39272 RepID=A0A8J2PKJ8_9HEXA|nr:unnamed protein product [Allacma fusca]
MDESQQVNLVSNNITEKEEQVIIKPERDEKISIAEEISIFPELTANGKTVFRRHILPWKQRYNWDCGIACVAMCVSVHDRYDLYRNLNFYKKHFQFNESTWTIDLCYVLKHFAVPFRFATRFPGVDPQLRRYTFYKSSIDKDTSRVLNGFALASKNGINFCVAKTHIQSILQHVYAIGPAIILVNSNLLRCLDCSSACSSVFSCCFRTCYQGHYILVIGFDLKNNCVFYNNPTFGDRTCRIYAGDFEAARTAPGTDWDTIFIESG